MEFAPPVKVLTRIANKKVGRVREANQNVIGTHLMISEITRNNWNPLGHEHLPSNVQFSKRKTCTPAQTRGLAQ